MDAADAEDAGIADGRNDSPVHEALLVNCGNAYPHDADALMSGKIAAMRTVFSGQFTDARVASLRGQHEAFRLAMRAQPPRNAAIS